jgi:ABC-type glycerol-3-phosphate transport system permease component
MTGRVLATAYVVTVTALTAYAFSSNDDHWPAEIAAAVLALPLVVPALPIIYVVGGLAWHGPMWVVTLSFTAMMTAVACGNALLFRAASSRRARTRSGA